MASPNSPRTRSLAAIVILLAGLLLTVAGNAPSHSTPPSPAQQQPMLAVAKLEYNRDVRPILAENCFACHGPDSAARKAGLRLDQREAAIQKGAITPGKPSESETIARILKEESDDELMPPVKSHKKLTAAQKETLKNWVAQGAEYQPHWSFIPPVRPPVPQFNRDTKGSAWIRTPIDAFVYAELQKRGLEPAPEADRRTLARRLSLDLTGLPPKPEDVEAFVNDKSAKYYEKFVDKLMATEQWGEHRGRYWLDAARYADTHGIHADNYREMWAYRDWVIRAFNRNLPFDRFTTEQLAGDLLPNPTLDQKVATGFNRCNITTNEMGSIPDECSALYTRDRTETAAQTWLGLTAGCAVCHDHKFDPISQKDFYALAAFFNNLEGEPLDGNLAAPPPSVAVLPPDDAPAFAAFEAEVKRAQDRVSALRAASLGRFRAWLATVTPADVAPPASGLVFAAPLAGSAKSGVEFAIAGKPGSLPLPAGAEWSGGPVAGSAALVVRSNVGTAEFPPGAGDFDADQPFAVSLWVRALAPQPTGALLAKVDQRADDRGWEVALDDRRFTFRLAHDGQTALVAATAAPVVPAYWHHVAVSYDGTRTAGGVTIFVNGKRQPVAVTGDPAAKLAGTIRNGTPLALARRSHGGGHWRVDLLDVRLYDRALTPADVADLAAVPAAAVAAGRPPDKRTPAELDALFLWWEARHDLPAADALADFVALQDSAAARLPGRTVAHISVEKAGPAEAYVLKRGEYNKRGEKVGADTPKALPGFGRSLPRNRLGLAKWLLSKDHPLTARVTVNRFWQELYGQGLVRTAGDFGITGELPSHPELLDWLAEEFESHWDVKRFFKLLVTSATYRQSAATKEKLEKDAGNRLLSRGPRFRMDAEMVRDYALAASGLLVPKVGGPSVKPYQPEGVWEAVAVDTSNTYSYVRDTGENLYRRSLYTFIKRSAPPASMEVFNAPNRETCAVKRERTNTPLQALVTLNDVQMVEAARVLAEKALAAAPTDDARLEFVANRILSRPLKTTEAEIVKGSLKDLLAEYKAKPAEAKKLIAFGESKADPKLKPEELAAWTMLCNELLNLDEVLNK